MHILILGAAGMLGRKLTAAILGGALTHDGLTLADVVAPPSVPGARSLAVDLTDAGAPARLLTDRPGLIFHLAAVVSAEAEADLATILPASASCVCRKPSSTIAMTWPAPLRPKACA